MRNVVAADEFAKLWESRTLTSLVHDARDELTRDLQKRMQMTAQGVEIRLYPGGTYQRGYSFSDEDGLIVYDDEVFGWNGLWKHVRRMQGHEV